MCNEKCPKCGARQIIPSGTPFFECGSFEEGQRFVQSTSCKLEAIRCLFRENILARRLLRELENHLFQIQGAHDGSISDECRAIFNKQLTTVRSLLET